MMASTLRARALRLVRQRKFFITLKYSRFLVFLGAASLRKRTLSAKKVRNLVLAKLYSEPRVARAVRFAVQEYPPILILDVTNRCNLRCVFCREFPNEFLDRKKAQAAFGVENQHYTQSLGAMDMKVVKKIVDEVREHALVCLLYVSGEPLMHPQIVEIVEYLSQNRILSIISTNGHYLTPKLGQRLLQAGLDSIHISVSGIRQETHEVYHRGGDIEKVKENVKHFVAAKRKLNARTWVDLRYIVTKKNEHEVAAAMTWGREVGLDSVTARSGTFFTLESAKEFLSANYNTNSLTIEEDRLVCNKQLRKCDWPWGVTIVQHNGEISPCCDAMYASRPIKIGNVGKRSLKEVWNGTEYRQLRKDLATVGRGKMDFCRNCFYDGFNFQS